MPMAAKRSTLIIRDSTASLCAIKVTCSPNSSPKSDTISDEGVGREHEEREIQRGTDHGGTSACPTWTAAELIDNVLQTGIKSGYSFSFAPGSVDSAGNIDTYAITASPITQGVTGLCYFYSDQTGVIRASSAAVATSSSTPLN
jgi:hypothetical protein